MTIATNAPQPIPESVRARLAQLSGNYDINYAQDLYNAVDQATDLSSADTEYFTEMMFREISKPADNLPFAISAFDRIQAGTGLSTHDTIALMGANRSYMDEQGVSDTISGYHQLSQVLGEGAPSRSILAYHATAPQHVGITADQVAHHLQDPSYRPPGKDAIGPFFGGIAALAVGVGVGAGVTGTLFEHAGATTAAKLVQAGVFVGAAALAGAAVLTGVHLLDQHAANNQWKHVDWMVSHEASYPFLSVPAGT